MRIPIWTSKEKLYYLIIILRKAKIDSVGDGRKKVRLQGFGHRH